MEFHRRHVALLPGRELRAAAADAGDAQPALGGGRHVAVGVAEADRKLAAGERGLEAALAVVARTIAEAVALVLVELARGLSVGVEHDEQRQRVGAQLSRRLRQLGHGDNGAWALKEQRMRPP